MKKLLLTVTLSLACVAAFAQGKVAFRNDSLHLVYWDPSAGTAFAGHAYLAGDGGYALTIELWAGTASTSLSLQGTTDFAAQSSPGTWAIENLTMPSVGTGVNFYDIKIHDSGNQVYGESGVFTSTANGGTAYYSLVQHTSPALSTWADGTYALDSILPGAKGAIMLTVPEPSTFALAGLAGAALMIFRRRK